MERRFTKTVAEKIAAAIVDKWGEADRSLFMRTDIKATDPGAFDTVAENDENEFDRLTESANHILLANDVCNPEAWGYDADDETPTIEELGGEIFWKREDFADDFDGPPALYLCHNSEHAFGASGCSQGFAGADDTDDEIDEGFWTRAFFGDQTRDADEYLSEVWDRALKQCAAKVSAFEEDGGKIEYPGFFRDWNGGPYHGRLTYAEGETAEELAEALETAFEEIVKADQTAFYKANKDEDWAKEGEEDED